MKKRTKLVGLILLAALLTATFSGCSYEEEYVPVDTQISFTSYGGMHSEISEL